MLPVTICGSGDAYVKHPFDCRKYIQCDTSNNRIFEGSCNAPYCLDIKTGQCNALCDCGKYIKNLYIVYIFKFALLISRFGLKMKVFYQRH